LRRNLQPVWWSRIHSCSTDYNRDDLNPDNSRPTPKRGNAIRLADENLSGRIVINLDAGMFTSTLLVLATLAPHLKYGDLIFFFEFL
jgi:hypothetical protein